MKCPKSADSGGPTDGPVSALKIDPCGRNWLPAHPSGPLILVCVCVCVCPLHEEADPGCEESRRSTRKSLANFYRKNNDMDELRGGVPVGSASFLGILWSSEKSLTNFLKTSKMPCW